MAASSWAREHSGASAKTSAVAGLMTPKVFSVATASPADGHGEVRHGRRSSHLRPGGRRPSGRATVARLDLDRPNPPPTRGISGPRLPPSGGPTRHSPLTSSSLGMPSGPSDSYARCVRENALRVSLAGPGSAPGGGGAEDGGISGPITTIGVISPTQAEKGAPRLSNGVGTRGPGPGSRIHGGPAVPHRRCLHPDRHQLQRHWSRFARGAVSAAAAGDTIAFSVACSPITLTGGPIDLTKNLTIDGPGANTLAVSGNGNSQVFDVNTGVTVSISGLTIEDGYNDDGYCSFDCSASAARSRTTAR